MSEIERHCMKCQRKRYEGEGVADGICGDCGLAAMFGSMPDVVCIDKEAGMPLTQKMIDRAVRENDHEVQKS